MYTNQGKALLTLGIVLIAGLVVAQQPPAKTGSTTQPPAKTTAATQPPAKTGTTPPEKNAPANQPAGKASNSLAEPLVTFTYDGVRLEGDYYPAPEKKGTSTPCLILVHAVGAKHLTSSRADFGKLPERLNKLGYAVVALDMRGYGKSKTVEPNRFWNTHTPKTKTLDLIEGKDHASSLELLEMVYDLNAVKTWLNSKNNAKDCNSHVIGVIGVEQGGLIAMAWAANELSDPNRVKNPSSAAALNPGANNGFANGQGNNNQGVGGLLSGFGIGGNRNNNNMNNGQVNTGQGTAIPKYEGEDITCIVSISTSNRLHDPLSYALMERWISFLRDRGVASMAIYGANDKEASTFWNKAVQWAKPTSDKYRFKNSGAKPIKNTSLVGAKLLSNDALDVPKVLEEYLQEAVKKAGESRLWGQQYMPDHPTPFEVLRILR
ncbi:MAG: alpha/beta fold hydrolase [Gemmatales bacterium]